MTHSQAESQAESQTHSEADNRLSYRAVYLSPHLDDVALSCGAQIYQRAQRGDTVLIATVTAGDPSEQALSGYAQSLHSRWALITDAVEERREEDQRAADVLGADVHHWPIPDCIYRFDSNTGEPFYTSDDDIFGAVHPVEEDLVAEMGRQIQGVGNCGELYIPLGVGNHVDHQLTRRAAEWAIQHWPGSSIPRLFYYEEYPYAQEHADATSRLLSQSANPMQLSTVQVSEAALDARIRAISEFKSQLSTFWATHAELVTQVRNYVEQVGGERVWHL